MLPGDCLFGIIIALKKVYKFFFRHGLAHHFSGPTRLPAVDRFEGH